MGRLKEKLTRLESAASVSAIKSGLIMVIPVLMIGSAALVFEYFPIVQYQEFIENALSGKLFRFLDLIYDATFGMLSVYLTCSVSFCYIRQYGGGRVALSAPITALICFFICSGVQTGADWWDALGVKGIFVAIFCALVATLLLRQFSWLGERHSHGYAEDADVEFNAIVSVLLPAACVVVLFSLINAFVTGFFKVNSFYALFVKAANAVFLPLGRSFLSGLLFVLVSSVLWFFGIHGSDVLESVMQTLFSPALDINIAQTAAGWAPTEIFTKQFFDVFVLMGGCGTALCLLLSVLLFSRRRRNRRISRLAVVPMLFNINELMIFGYPVIYNTTLLLPFLLTPVFSFVTTYFAMRTGLVPLITAEVNWTAPVLLSGYTATGSVAGSLLQLFNLTVGVFIYRPFVLAYDRRCEAAAQALVGSLTDAKKESERTLEPATLTKLADARGTLARSMAADLKFAIEEQALHLNYQPQYDGNGHCVGIEALLRWKHPLYGMIYPPLIIQLARETGLLPTLEAYVLRRAVEDSAVIRGETGYDKELSVNISSATLHTPGYLALLKELSAGDDMKHGEICLEITEQTALLSDDETFEQLQQIKDMGYRLAIDDFSMGHTSLTYLQANCFDIVKLDGKLITDMMTNPRSYDIIKTITGLAQKLGFSVIAEYVETDAQVKMLQSANCFQYQGYLFSPAIGLDALITRLKADRAAQR